MDTEENNTITQLMKRIDTLEEELGKKVNAENEEKSKFKRFTSSIFRSLILGLTLFSITMLIREFSKDPNENINPKINKQHNSIINNKSIKVDSTKILLLKKIDSLEKILIDEVSGESGGKPGYGPKARETKKLLDTLKRKL